MSRPDIFFPVIVVSQLKISPWIIIGMHLSAFYNILSQLQATNYISRIEAVSRPLDIHMLIGHTDRHSTSQYCVFIGGNLVPWKSRNRIWLLNLVQKQFIEHWFGSNNFLENLNLEKSDGTCM